MFRKTLTNEQNCGIIQTSKGKSALPLRRATFCQKDNFGKRKGVIYTDRYFSAAETDFSSDDVYTKREKRAYAYCEHCGFAIYSPDDALIVDGSEDVIHLACWGEYCTEHMFDFAKIAAERDR